MVVSIKVIPNYELERLIISYGEKVKVIFPKFIRDKIQSRIQEMFNLYGLLFNNDFFCKLPSIVFGDL